MRARIELDYQGKRNEAFLSRGLDRFGNPIPGLAPKPFIPAPGLEPTGQSVDEFGNLQGTTLGRAFKETGSGLLADERKSILGRYAPEGVLGKDRPSSSVAKSAIQRALDLGIISEAPKEADFLGGVRSLGQRISADALRMLTGGFLQPRRENASAIPQIATRTQPISSAAQGGLDLSSFVSDAATLLSSGRTTDEIIDRLIELGLSEDDAVRIVEEASGSPVR